ncbi:DNA ligase [Ferrimonas kyonanensis]|uniref:DNA ligase n=1 Tax=Ferrimonas kyonanensis TaxID=364763 RepID=UPI000404B292|nr:DNA ligase [Ferrimonas kyonanensis]
MNRHSLALAVSLSLTFSHYPFTATAQAPTLMLASDYPQSLDLSQYLVSEKLDGIRAYWDGSTLWSRSGERIHAPSWFTAPLPAIELEGELWMGRGRFQTLMSIVRDQQPDEKQWRQVGLYLFDLPMGTEPFQLRYQRLQAIARGIDRSFIEVVEQRPISSPEALQQQLQLVTELGGEGLMLHHKDNLYLPGRSSQLLKYKSYQDAEAVVVAHQEGKGKYQGMLGAVEVETQDGRRFRIGSGFSDAERQNPPAIGTVITYRYNGTTDAGLPRFARYLRPHPML